MCLDTFGQERGEVMGVFVEKGDEGRSGCKSVFVH